MARSSSLDGHQLANFKTAKYDRFRCMALLNVPFAVRDVVRGSQVNDSDMSTISIDRAPDAVGRFRRSLPSRTDPPAADRVPDVSLVGVCQFAEPGAQ